MHRSNWSVSRTRTSWPRFSPSFRSARVLYSSGCRDRMTTRMAGPLLVGLPLQLLQQVLPAYVHKEISRQRLPAEDDRKAHLAAVGDRQADDPGQRAEPDPSLDQRPPFALAAGIADHDRTQHRHLKAHLLFRSLAVEGQDEVSHTAVARNVPQFIVHNPQRRSARPGVDFHLHAAQTPIGEVDAF